jgi:hypothetical protein
MIDRIANRVAPSGSTLRVVAPEDVRAANLEDKFPLWSAGASENVLALDNSRAVASGLDLRPLEDSVDDVVSWWGDREWPAQWLTSEDERRLVLH